MNKKLIKILQLLFGLTILLLLLFKVGIEDIYQNLRTLGTLNIIIVIMLFLSSQFLSALGLKFLIMPFDNIKYSSILKRFIKAFAYSTIAPGKIGEASLILTLKNKKLNYGKTSAIFLLDKLISISIAALLALAGIYTLFRQINFYHYLFISIIFFAAVYLIFFTKKGRSYIKKIMGKREKKFTSFYSSISSLIKHNKKEVVGNILTTIIRMLIVAAMIKYIFFVLGHDIDIIYALLIKSITVLITLIPITINGLGTKEMSGAYLFHEFAIPIEVSTSMYMVVLIIQYVYAFAIFTISFISSHRR